MRKSVARLSVILSTAIVGCHEQSILCPLIRKNAVLLHVKDSLTGAFVASGAKVVARSGTYADSSEFPPGQAELDGQPLGAAREPGVYTVTVSKAGYSDWVKMGVSVSTAGKCELRTTDLDALLQPSP